MADYRPEIQAYDRSLSVFTVRDAVQELLDAFDVDDSGRHGRTARRAVIEAYRDLPNYHRWAYYRTLGQVVTVASQTTGTIAYDHTGGASERLVTLTGATFPTDARYYEITISDEQYKVESYQSSTTITLTQDSNPGADVASGTSYVMFRRAYPVPIDFRRGTELVRMQQSYWPDYVQPDELLGRMTNSYTPQSEPDCYTIRSDQEHYGGLVFEFAPPPSTAKTYRFDYERTPSPLRTFTKDAEYREGTVAVSGTTVTGTSTAWTSDMVGCIIRFPQPGTSTPPTGLVGDDSEDAPYAEQRVITAVGDATTITVDVAPTGTYSDVQYTIGSPLDIEHGAMYSAFMRLAEYSFSRMISRSEKLDQYGAPQRKRVFLEALRDAMSFDNRNKHIIPDFDYEPHSLADIASR